MNPVAPSFVFLLLVIGASSNSMCPRQCRCDSARRTVYCMNQQLLNLPLGIPTNTKRLLLQNNKLVNTHELDNILGTLTSLERLELSNNSLTAFPKRLPSSLNWISMRDNSIKYIGSNSLSGLKSLKTLYLDNNSLTNQGLSPSAFIGGENLHTLSLQANLLTSVPKGLPKGLRNGRFSQNLISKVSKSALEHLKHIVSLELNNNALNASSIERYALKSLTELRYLDLSRNHLTFVPSDLPGNLTQLLLSHNRIKSISAVPFKSERTKSLAGLTGLEHIDLSFNRLQSVEPTSFSDLRNLNTVILHDNPWRCDCHLVYLKHWLMETSALMTMESKTICHTPDAIQGVPLQSLDEEVLTCSPAKPPTYNVSVSTNAILISWLITETSYPEYMIYSAFCGDLVCENCSQQEIIESTSEMDYSGISSIVKSYDIFPVDYNKMEFGIARIDIPNRKPNQLYILCLLNSYDAVHDATVRKCEIVKTKSSSSTTPASLYKDDLFIPIWLVVLIAFLAVVVIAIIALVIYCKKANAKKQKWKRGMRPGAAQMTYDPFRQIYAMPGDSRSDRMVDSTVVGGVNISNYREGNLSSTKDAGKEFDVTLMMYSNQNHNYLHPQTSPQACDSFCSDCHNDTISTSHTRTETTNGSMHSQLDVNETPQRSGNYHGLNSNECGVTT